MREASDTMFRAFGCGIGGPIIDCSCGRTHCAIENEYISDTERQEFIAMAGKSPKRVFLHEFESISAKIIDGMSVVIDCECEFLVKLEDILWNERDRILSYYKMRREQEAASIAQLDARLRDAGVV